MINVTKVFNIKNSLICFLKLLFMFNALLQTFNILFIYDFVEKGGSNT